MTSKQFTPPTAEQRTKALGDTSKLDTDLLHALTVGINESFLPIPVPNDGDWLSIYEESGQTLKQFEKTKRTRPHSTYRTIYVQPIGECNHPRAPSLETICEFSSHFFPGCLVEILPSIDFDSKTMKQRLNPYTNQPQYLTTNLIDHLKKMQRKRSRDRRELFCVGITMADIYPRSSWNFVYGIASIEDGVGIYSFARLDPMFPGTPDDQFPCTEEERLLILKRAIGVFVHEVIHLFGLEHCIYYLCLMNGTNNGEEMDGQPLYLCPVCLRKMYSSLNGKTNPFDVKKIYRGISDLCRKLNFKDEMDWYENRLRMLDV
ncbi:unnamed protein product [Didymodactylos carnosus]|uniref:Archaemetzincin-2 n=1 Tax=Didymodactylos carnosus TaxID=1234261 RepID=A0A814JIF5_9BILA|nr:unnamed protein product [Didymodactylos carnosus]CAF1178529.1 unnamed protein product [Didymodactylos carnosus]CAF3810033.1 unnamed protein product [Didymodactylos carnosus]CAF3989862.1 unnamed protein product [Didymodactylos carnosus]